MFEPPSALSTRPRLLNPLRRFDSLRRIARPTLGNWRLWLAMRKGARLLLRLALTWAFRPESLPKSLRQAARSTALTRGRYITEERILAGLSVKESYAEMLCLT